MELYRKADKAIDKIKFELTIAIIEHIHGLGDNVTGITLNKSINVPEGRIYSIYFENNNTMIEITSNYYENDIIIQSLSADSLLSLYVDVTDKRYSIIE